MRTLILVLCFTSVIWAQDGPIEDGWKGIKVFMSNRSEVEKVFGGVGEKIIPGSTSYRIGKNTRIHFVYSHEPCSDEGDGRFNLPKDTVLEYEIFLQDGIDVNKFQWNKKLYEVYNDEHTKWITWYYNKESAIRISTVREKGPEQGQVIEKVSTIRFERNWAQNSDCVCAKYRKDKKER